MAPTYKVWAQIERVDHENDDYENVSEEQDIACFETQEEAEDFLAEICDQPALLDWVRERRQEARDA